METDKAVYSYEFFPRSGPGFRVRYPEGAAITVIDTAIRDAATKAAGLPAGKHVDAMVEIDGITIHAQDDTIETDSR